MNTMTATMNQSELNINVDIVTLREEVQQRQRDPRDKQDGGPCNLRVMVADDV